jgi:uncharacterized protein YndB with AHSA1/START domain
MKSQKLKKSVTKDLNKSPKKPAEGTREPAESKSPSKIEKQLRSEAYYAAPIERVWQALTDPAELALWFAKGDFKPKTGHRFRWKDEAQRTPLGDGLCEVQEVNEHQSLTLKIEHVPGSLVSFVTWSLKPEGEGTRFIVEQEFLTQEELKPHPQIVSLALYRRNRAMIESASKWKSLLEFLASCLERGASFYCGSLNGRRVA